METSNMYPMFCGIMPLEESQRGLEIRRSFRWHFHRKEIAEKPIGAGMDLTAEWNGVPALYLGVPISVAILTVV